MHWECGTVFEMFEANWIEVKGTRYQRGCTILAALEDSNIVPVFVTVKHIFIRDSGIIWFIGERYKTLYFNSHFHSYVVRTCSPSQLMHVSPGDLFYYWPVAVHKMTNTECEQLLMGLRYRI